MTDLVEFLHARIGEDEQAAHDGPFPGSAGDRWKLRTWEGNYTFGTEIDPARVLAECEAKRRIIDAASLVIDKYAGGMFLDYARETLRLLAVPYADHPDYREEWRP